MDLCRSMLFTWVAQLGLSAIVVADLIKAPRSIDHRSPLSVDLVSATTSICLPTFQPLVQSVFKGGLAMDLEASTKSPAGSLPQEIIDTIIDNFALPVSLARDDPLCQTRLASLKACSLVCHAFLPRSQTHIFSVLGFSVKVVHEDRNAGTGRTAGLINLLKTKTHIAQNMRGITVDWETRHRGFSTWHIDDTKLLAHMQTLCSNITSLSVQAFQAEEDGNELWYIPRSLFKPSLLANFKAITRLRLDNLVVSVSTFALYPALRDLSCSKINIISASEPATATSTSRISRLILHSLQFDWTADESIKFLANLVDGTGDKYPVVLDLSQLRSFRHSQHALANEMKHLVDLGRILRRCVSLEKLDLRGSWLPLLLRKLDKDSTIFRLSQLPKLAELVIDAMIIDFQEGTWDVEDNPLTDSPFLDIINFLNIMPAENSLSRLELEFVFRSYRRDPSIVNISATAKWEQLAAQVVRIANGKTLEVKLNIVWIVCRRFGANSTHVQDVTLLEEKNQVSNTLHGGFNEDLLVEMQSLRACQWVKMNISYDVC